MPSITHQGLVELFRARPTLALEVLQRVLATTLPVARSIEVTSASVDELVPTEHRADLMLLMRDGSRTIVGVVIVEVQLAIDADKPFTWPLYAFATRNRFRCPTWLLVVAPEAAVASWAHTPLPSAPGHPAWGPMVLGPDETPHITTASEAEQAPELALLSAIAHGGNENAKALLDALPAALATMPGEMLPAYLAMLYATLAPALRAQLERLMTTTPFTSMPLPPFIQRIIDVGKAEGEREGKREGKTEGLATATLKLLELRGIDVPASVRAEVMACTDLATLDHWFERAARLKSAAAVVRSRPKP